jgi:hypothetical protein
MEEPDKRVIDFTETPSELVNLHARPLGNQIARSRQTRATLSS